MRVVAPRKTLPAKPTPRREPMVGLLFAGIVIALASPCLGQFPKVTDAQRQAARSLIVQGVQQGISSLPPSSGQAFSYRFNKESDTYERTESLGPTSFHSTRTVGEGHFTIRFATSYFELSDQFEPKEYLIEFDEPFPPGPLEGRQPAGITAYGLGIDAKVALFMLSGTYGVSKNLEVTLNLPVTVVDAEARHAFTTRHGVRNVPVEEAVASGVFHLDGLPADPAARAASIEELRQSFRRLRACKDPNCLAARHEPFEALDAQAEFDGTDPGLGRVSVGLRQVAYTHAWFRLALMTELFFPSPSEDEYAGPDSWAIFPRVVVDAPVVEDLRLHANIGYDHDFDSAELRRLAWSVGASWARSWYSFDVGVGGSEYDEPIRWTPSRLSAFTTTPSVPPATGTVLGDNSVGDTFVDFLAGAKVEVADDIAVSAAVVVPLNAEGFRPEAQGTVAIETSF